MRGGRGWGGGGGRERRTEKAETSHAPQLCMFPEGHARCVQGQNPRPVSSFRAKTVLPFLDPLSGEAAVWTSEPGQPVYGANFSPSRFRGVPAPGEEPRAGCALSSGPWPSFHPRNLIRGGGEGYRPNPSLACFPNPPLFSSPLKMGPHLLAGRAAVPMLGASREPCPTKGPQDALNVPQPGHALSQRQRSIPDPGGWAALQGRWGAPRELAGKAPP